MEPIRYRPGEALRWLEQGADQARTSARAKGKKLTESDPLDGALKRVGKGLQNAAGAVVDLGKGAVADLLLAKADASEFVMLERQLDIVHGKTIRSIAYADITAIRKKGDRYSVATSTAAFTVRPYAYIVAGRIRVPIGWERNGLEVGFELFAEELAGRAGVSITTD